MPKMTTNLMLAIGESSTEVELHMIVDYAYTPGGLCNDVDCVTIKGASITLGDLDDIKNGGPIPADWLIGLIEQDDGILEECCSDWQDREEYARESAVDARREEMKIDQARLGS